MAFLTYRLIDTSTTRLLSRKSYTETVKGELPSSAVCEKVENPEAGEDVSFDEPKEDPFLKRICAKTTALKMVLGEKTDRVLVTVYDGGAFDAVLVRPVVILNP